MLIRSALGLANAVLVGERRHRITPAEAAELFVILRSFPIHVDSETAAKAWVETIELGRIYGLSSYDASYLELAIRLGLPIATLDEKLAKASLRAGVTLFDVR